MHKLNEKALDAARKARDQAWPMDSLVPAITAYLAALPPEQNTAQQPTMDVVEGWKLVPSEPDEAMIDAGQEVLNEKNLWGGRVYSSDVWSAMYNAAGDYHNESDGVERID